MGVPAAACALALAALVACESGVHVHDHTPSHGGVVAMSGDHHVEALARDDGLVRFWITDFARVAVPLAGVRGRAIVRTGDDGRVEAPLVVRDGALEARLPGLVVDPAEVRFEAVLPGDGSRDERLMIDFTLPLATAAPRG